jgi:hypothetical protein
MRTKRIPRLSSGKILQQYLYHRKINYSSPVDGPPFTYIGIIVADHKTDY